jgi:hypothetical protein
MAESFEIPQITDRSPFQQSIIDFTLALCSEYLNNAVSEPSLTAKRIADMALDYQTSDEKFEDFVSHFWITTLWVVKQIPHNNPNQDKMVNLLVKLQVQSPPPLQPVYEWSYLPFWTSLPGITFAIVQYRYGAPMNPPYAERPGIGPDNNRYHVTVNTTEWTNLNAFLARLLAAVGHHTSREYYYLVFHLSCEGLYAMLDALEENNGGEQQAIYTPTAACWILYAGRQLNQLTQLYPHQGRERASKRLPWSAGDLYHGPVGFNKQHWSFWKDRFKVLTKDDSLKDEARGWAAKALVEMDAIDANLGQE